MSAEVGGGQRRSVVEVSGGGRWRRSVEFGGGGRLRSVVEFGGGGRWRSAEVGECRCRSVEVGAGR